MKQHPNIFFFIIDAVRYDTFGLHGYRRPTTPFLQEVCSDGGVFFDNAFSSVTWTLPAHLTYLTGLSTFQHQVDFGIQRTTPEKNSFLFLPVLLKQAGYASALVSEQVFLTPKIDVARVDPAIQCLPAGFLPEDMCGFDLLDAVWDYLDKTALRMTGKKKRMYRALVDIASSKKVGQLRTRNWIRFDELVQQVDKNTEVWPDLEPMYRQSGYFASRYNMFDDFFAEHRQTDPDRPFFMMTNVHTGQMNFDPELRKKWFQQYFKANLDIDVSREELDFFDTIDFGWLRENISTATWEILHAYDLTFMDCTVRLLNEKFTEQGHLTDEDYFICVTDHGLGKGETDLSPRNCHHGAFPFEWLIHSPLVVRGPAFADYAGTLSRSVSTLDIYPTIAKLAGVDIHPLYKQFLRGRPLQDRLIDDSFESAILVEAMIYVNEQGRCVMPEGRTMEENWSGHQRGFCLVTGAERLVCIPGKRMVLLYDIEQDALFEHPIQDTARLAPAMKKLEKIMAEQVPTNLVGAPAAPQEVPEPVADERVVKSLKALGYY